MRPQFLIWCLTFGAHYKNDGHYFCGVGGNRPDGSDEALTLKAVYQALEAFAEAWEHRYPQISRSWQSNWNNLSTFFSYPLELRKVFPTDESVKKVVWLAIQAVLQKWTMPLQDWRMAMSRFIIEFGDRLDGHF